MPLPGLCSRRRADRGGRPPPARSRRDHITGTRIRAIGAAASLVALDVIVANREVVRVVLSVGPLLAHPIDREGLTGLRAAGEIVRPNAARFERVGAGVGAGPDAAGTGAGVTHHRPAGGTGRDTGADRRPRKAPSRPGRRTPRCGSSSPRRRSHRTRRTHHCHRSCRCNRGHILVAVVVIPKVATQAERSRVSSFSSFCAWPRSASARAVPVLHRRVPPRRRGAIWRSSAVARAHPTGSHPSTCSSSCPVAVPGIQSDDEELSAPWENSPFTEPSRSGRRTSAQGTFG